MSNPYYFPPLVEINWNMRNGMTPSAYTWQQLVQGANHCAKYRHRQVYMKALELGTDVTGVSALQGVWRFRTGRDVSHVTVVMLMGLTSASAGLGSTSDPYATVDFTISGGATTSTDPFRYSSSTGTINDAPDEMSVQYQDVAVTANTVYECALNVANYARPIAIMVYEWNDDSTLNTHNPTSGSPIYDVHREDVLVSLSNAYRSNGAMNFHWSLVDGAARTRSNATPASVFDGTSTGTPTAGSSNGFYLSPQYHRTHSRTTVPMEWAVYASMSAGTGTCRLIDSSGNTYGSINVNSATPQWWTATFNIPESAEIFLVPQMAGDGAGTLSVRAVSVIEWETGP